MWSYILIVICTLMMLVHGEDGPIINTVQGPVRGSTANDGDYYVFYGIPYGGSTSRQNRFKAPTPPPNRAGVFDATNNGIFCAQPTSRGLFGEEDCLTLSIFTKNITSADKPVFVWLIGEEYTTSNALAYSYKRLAEEDLVIVVINYRLSIFGFLCLGIEEAPGNAGLRDVVQGLRWIRENIAGFGGNPNNIVLFGHGSGAAMVDLITMSPLAENLVHKAIAQSGSALASWAVSHDPVGNAEALGAKLNFTGDSKKELAELFINTTANRLVSEINGFEFLDNTVLFAPCIDDKNLNPDDVFLPGAPIDLLRAGNYSHIPYITGYTDKEGTLRARQAANGQWLEMMQSNFTNFLPADLNLTSEVGQSIRQYYFNNSVINMQNIEAYLNYHGDTMVLVPLIRSSFERARTSTADVRLYQFGNMKINNMDWAYPEIPLTGVPHGDIIHFLLGINLHEIDRRVMDSLVNRFAAFANTGIPNYVLINNTVSTNSVTWLPILTNNNQVVVHYYVEYYGGEGNVPDTWIDGQMLRSSPHSLKMKFWNDIYSENYVAPLPPTPSAAVNVLGITLTILFSQMFLRVF